MACVLPRVPQRAYFRRKCSVLLIDNRGVGRSSLSTGLWTVQDHAVDVLAVLRGLEWYNIHLVGHSFGGLVCYELLRRTQKAEPGLFASLSLLGCVVFLAPGADDRGCLRSFCDVCKPVPSPSTTMIPPLVIAF